MDPLCEKYYSTSPYAWCGNNPVRFVDPDGRVLLDPATQALANKGKERAEAIQTQFLFDSNSVPSSFFADKTPTYNAITIWTIAFFKSGDTDNLFPYSWMARFSNN